MSRKTTKCPHENVAYCPLYVASHRPELSGCDDGRLAEGGCAVSRGMNYSESVKKLLASAPTLQALCQFDEKQDAAHKQCSRNMRLNGIH